jgi:mono/diheme cytochrome c family protein
MGSMHQRTVMLGAVLLGAVACASGESSESAAASSGARDPATVASSPPLPGFSASDPAGRIPGSPGPSARTDTATPAASAGAGTNSPASAPAAGSGAPGGSTGGTSAAPSAAPAAGATRSPGVTLAAGEISTATGVFTAAQATRGRDVYAASCANCHMASAHTGGTFASNWNGKRVSDLYDLIQTTMPVDSPGSLTAQQYADVVAHMFQLNGLPTGNTPLLPDAAALRKIRIEFRPGTAP